MHGDEVRRLLAAFADELAGLPATDLPAELVDRTGAALDAALTQAAGRPEHPLWTRLYFAAARLIAELEDRSALPGLRAFLAENADLCDERADLVPV